ncbi:MAG: vWA domain-containing protein, partial [Planctomycetota bacterium]
MRRYGPLAVRLAALLAIAALWLAALDWPSKSREAIPARVRAVTTAENPERLRDLQTRLAAEGVGFAAPAYPGRLAERLLQARLQDPEAELLLLWNGSFDPEAQPSPGALPAIALSDRDQPMVEPDWFELRALGSMQVDRPLALELRLEEGAERGPWQGHLRLLDATGELIANLDFAAADLDEPLRLDVPEVEAGAYQVELQIDLPEAGRMRASGGLEITASPALHILGSAARARQTQAALAAQGLDAELIAELPTELSPDQVLVASRPLSEAEQSRLVEFVDSGGGLFLIGDEAGGALPLAGEPLHEFLPVVMPDQLASSGEAEGEDGKRQETQDPEEDKSEPSADPVQPDPPKPDPNPPPDQDPEPETPPQGDLSTQNPPESVTEEEVQRRSVALMLIVDRSGSMGQPSSGGRSKMDDAKRSAYDTAYNLEDGDELGLIAFGEHGQELEVLKLGPRPRDSKLRTSLETLRAEAPRTQLGSALNLSLTRLSASKLPVRHAVVITDGNLPDFADVLHCRTVADRMAKLGITLSIIQVLDLGDASSPLELKRIADAGRGVLHRSRNRGAIPSLVLSEVKRVLGAVGRRPASEAALAEPNLAKQPEPIPEPPVAEPEPEPEPQPEPEPEEQAEDEAPSEPEADETGAAGSLVVRAVSPSVLLEPIPEDGFPKLGGVLPVTGRAEARVLLA